MSLQLHPATVLLLWTAAAVGLQQLDLLPLSVLVGAGLAATVWRWPLRTRSVLRRVRWLLITTAVLFVWASPGEYIPWLPGATYEGMQQAGRHIACLVLFLVMLVALLELMGVEHLIGAMHAIAAPLRVLGFNRDRAVIRLLLVLDYLERPATAGGWRALLREELVEAPLEMAPLTLRRYAWRWFDALLLVALSVGIFFAVRAA